ncbi:hypothetical protein [Companilactobacillus sp.]|jgi:hypothetical protein|uniref:hypothetical protein n=1 Tax=Companilactobacillus sp. TaxID=2767905 RepID=UPI0025BB1D8F|nr:hypothetical protein [Companilactobacillus sp.]MCH4009930.1 hypothetical protein [Companilactobacillus sp.]MCH4052394.1 hypothetical protein [Companilactobacillus sp.]MCH4077872.1 hypothetical protein [Companilactobacillus sp.]MCH4126448.1 hypothetical protein [Companilactobacillus sp.]MCH4132034.1 hypothetical protein [Companilactobacillus sp.]
MRKIKFAGVAAATLLAISPVATNALGNTEGVAQAATTDTTSTPSFGSIIETILNKVTDYIKGLQDKGTDSTAKPETSAAQKAVDDINGLKDTYTFDEKNVATWKSFSALYNANNIEKQDIAVLTDALYPSLKLDDKTVAEIKAADNLKVTISGAADNSDFKKTIMNMVNNGNGQQFQVNIQVTDSKADNPDATLVNKTITFVNNKQVTVPSTSLAIKYTSPVSLPVGSSVLEQTLTSSVNDQVTNEAGATVKPASVNAGDFYKTANDAIAGTNKLGLGANFNVDGATYYQPVTLTFDKNAVDISKIYNEMITTGEKVLTLNGENVGSNAIKGNTITYVRTIQVGAGFVNPDNNNNNENNNNNNTNTENGIWVEDSTIGTVQVKNSTASLYNDDNDITNRALAANSSWATDKSRVNSKTGLKQYHVSTHEWVNASDITFTSKDGNTTNNNGSTSGLNNITDLQGYHAVKLDGPTGFVYALYSQNGTRSNRGLAGLTSWYTDKSATDNQGNTYYRVSTDEWVRASTGVTLN